ncbi:hypothetical protein EDB81DRAFT_913055, partial [Dactylonectria macrodidyma]
ADPSALAASPGSGPSRPLPDSPYPPLIEKFLGRFLSFTQSSQITQQFYSSWHRNRNIMWTGNIRYEAQTWADRRDMRTLSTAMGPLAHGDNPPCLQASKGNGRSKYMRGASAVFAWHVTADDDVVTILCPPPPYRFNPGGGTNIQLVELPILIGIVGGRAVSRIEAVHPMVHGAEDFRYQLWPVDDVRIWINKFAKVSIQRTVWLPRSRKGQVKQIEQLLRSTPRHSEKDAVYRAILHEESSTSMASVSKQSGSEHVDSGNLPATQSETPKKKKKKKKKKKGTAASELAPISEGLQVKELKTQPQASSEKTKTAASSTRQGTSGSAKGKEKEVNTANTVPQSASGKKNKTEAPLGTGQGASKVTQGKAKKAGIANTVPQSKASVPMGTGTRGGLAGGNSSSQAQSLTKDQKKRGKTTLSEGLTAAKEPLGKTSRKESTETAATIAASAAPSKTKKTQNLEEAKEVKKKDKEVKKKNKEVKKKDKEIKKKDKEEKNKQTQLKPQGSSLPSTNTPGQTACRLNVCKADQEFSFTTPPLLMQSRPKANGLLTLTIQKLRSQDTVTERQQLSLLVGLSAECIRAELCLQPAQASLFIIPTASWLTLERTHCGRK